MRKLYLTFLVLALSLGFVAAGMNHSPSFNVKLTWMGEMNVFQGSPSGSVLFTNGDMVRVMVRGLEPDTFYSLHHGSDCVDFDMKTNRHGNLKTMKVEWDYSDLYMMREVSRGGMIPTLNEGVAEDFELKNFKCSASTGEMILGGVEPKNHVRVWTR